MRLIPVSIIAVILLSAFNVQAGAARPSDVLVTEAYVRGLPPGQTNTTAFMSLTNRSNQNCVLTSASSPVAKRTELHGHSHQGDMMRMRPVKRLPIPAGETVQLRSGGYHLMLFDLQKPLLKRDRVPIILYLGDCGSVRLSASVVSVFYGES